MIGTDRIVAHIQSEAEAEVTSLLTEAEARASALAEEVMVARDLAIAQDTGAAVVIQHISSGISVELVRQAKARGVRAFAEATPHHFTLTEQDVLDFCKGKIAWYKTPKYIQFVDEFPLNAAGKIKKFVLREMAHELWPDA